MVRLVHKPISTGRCGSPAVNAARLRDEQRTAESGRVETAERGIDWGLRGHAPQVGRASRCRFVGVVMQIVGQGHDDDHGGDVASIVGTRCRMLLRQSNTSRRRSADLRSRLDSSNVGEDDPGIPAEETKERLNKSQDLDRRVADSEMPRCTSTMRVGAPDDATSSSSPHQHSKDHPGNLPGYDFQVT